MRYFIIASLLICLAEFEITSDEKAIEYLSKLSESKLKDVLSNSVNKYCDTSVENKTGCATNFLKDLEKKATNIMNKTIRLINKNPLQVWGYGLGAATLICVLSCMGALCLRFQKNKYLDYFILAIQAFAVGVLSGNALVHLIPDGLGLDETKYPYAISKSLMTGLTLVLFCIVDAVIILVGTWSSTKGLPNAHLNDPCGMICQKECEDGDNIEQSKHSDIYPNSKSSELLIDVARINCFGSMVESKGLMIIIGDMLHNLIDGLAIGVSFSHSLSRGLSTTIGVIAEEVPHEIGDMTILVSSGFTVCKAILWNFISCLSCHLGVIIILSLGKVSSDVVDFVEMICGGAFLYISFISIYPHVLNSAILLSKNRIKPYCYNLVLVFTMIVSGQSFMAGISYFDKYTDLFKNLN